LLKPLVTSLELRFEMRRSFAVFIVFLCITGAIVLAMYLLIPIAVKNIQSMSDALQTFPFDKKLNEKVQDLARSYPFINSASATEKVHVVLQRGMDLVRNSLETVAGFAANIIIVPFISYFLIADGDKAAKNFVEHIPNKYFEMALNVIHKIEASLVGYLKGWMLECTIIGILSIIGLSFLGINYAVFIGTTAGIANLVPYFGPIVGALLAVIVSITQTGDFSMLGPILLLTVCIRLIDDMVVQPLCFSTSIDMHPLAVVLVLLFGHELMGIAGLVLAMPIATILRVTAVETYWGLKHYRITSSSAAHTLSETGEIDLQ
jgi:predicted PurR-regulated permease PerM